MNSHTLPLLSCLAAKEAVGFSQHLVPDPYQRYAQEPSPSSASQGPQDGVSMFAIAQFHAM